MQPPSVHFSPEPVLPLNLAIQQPAFDLDALVDEQLGGVHALHLEESETFGERSLLVSDELDVLDFRDLGEVLAKLGLCQGNREAPDEELYRLACWFCLIGIILVVHLCYLEEF